jgi:hypothetical protein
LVEHLSGLDRAQSKRLVDGHLRLGRIVVKPSALSASNSPFRLIHEWEKT